MIAILPETYMNEHDQKVINTVLGLERISRESGIGVGDLAKLLPLLPADGEDSTRCLEMWDQFLLELFSTVERYHSHRSPLERHMISFKLISKLTDNRAKALEQQLSLTSIPPVKIAA